MKPTILTHTGTEFDFTAPEQHDFNIEDIAHALSNICRFTGHTAQFYSVAQHSVLVSRHVPAEYALQGLLHDAAEAYLGDVAKPLKNLLPDYQAIEARVEKALFNHFGLPEKLHYTVKFADRKLLHTEQRDFMGVCRSHFWTAPTNEQPLKETIEPWEPGFAEYQFMKRYEELTDPKNNEVS